MESINIEEAERRSLADAHGDEDEAVARSIVDSAAERREPTTTNGLPGTQREQHVNAHANAPPTTAQTFPTPAPNPDKATPTRPRPAHTPPHLHPGNRGPGRRVVTWFSGYDGFREAAVVHEPRWQVVNGTEDVETDKGRRIAKIWEDNNPGGRILGHHDEVQRKLRDGTLQLGHVDLPVITYPCWDHADCSTEGQFDGGTAGSFKG